MKTWRKWMALAVCACLFLGLVACGGNADSANATDAADATNVASTANVAEVEKAAGAEADNATPVDTVITTEADSYTVVETETVAINAQLETSGKGVSLSYTSEDETIATVSKYGKIKGISEGSTRIAITSSDGVEKIVEVTVEKRVVEKVLRLALNVMWNDTALGCYNNETGPVIEVTEDGQYTVTFDCAAMSDATRALGVTGLMNLTSIYIKDYDVTAGNLARSNVIACEIRWDEIYVDGVPMTITNGEFKDAMKTSGIFDTNDPFNAWDGSSVEEVTVDTENHVLNINLDNPQTVSVTFTLSGLTFYES